MKSEMERIVPLVKGSANMEFLSEIKLLQDENRKLQLE